MKALKIILIYNLILFGFVLTASAIKFADSEIGDIITNEDIKGADFDTDSVYVTPVEVGINKENDDNFDVLYQIKTIITDEEVKKIGVLENVVSINKVDWNDCRNNGIKENDCYRIMKENIISQVRTVRQQETEKLKTLQGELTKQDYWSEFDPKQLNITSEDLN